MRVVTAPKPRAVKIRKKKARGNRGPYEAYVRRDVHHLEDRSVTNTTLHSSEPATREGFSAVEEGINIHKRLAAYGLMGLDIQVARVRYLLRHVTYVQMDVSSPGH